MQPQPEWRSYFPALSFDPHSGQRETYEIAAAEDPAVDKLIRLPTGYGKSRGAAGYYAIARERGLVNRLLWIVSSDLQRLALSPEPNRVTGEREPTISDNIAGWFGLPCLETITVTGAWQEIRAHRENYAEIFVTSYQFLRQQTTYFKELMETGNWLVTGDEAHHLSVSGAWANWLERLQRVGTLYMSATPLRTDKLPLRNVPRSEDGKTFKACVNVSEKDAIDEHAIRRPIAHAQEWELEFRDKTGKLVTYTTSQLRDLDIKESDEFDAWVIKNDLHYTMAHLQRIVLDAANCLDEKRAGLPGRPAQMLVYAMSCKHAQFLANQVFPSVGYETKAGADWVGVTRSDAENKDVIGRFKRGSLPILVQVNKAGEGFDHSPTSVGLWLNMTTSETKLLQELGRIMRRQFEIEWQRDTGDAFANTAHGIGPLIQTMQPKDDEFREPREGPAGGEGPYDWPPLPALTEIEAKWLKTDVFGPDGIVQQPPGVLQAARKFGMTPDDVRNIVHMATGSEVRPQQSMGEVGRRAQLEARVDSTMALIARQAIDISSANGTARDPQMHRKIAGWVKTNLNTRWKRDARIGHKEMLSDDFARKYEWLREIHEGMRLTGKVPSWLTAPKW